MEVVRAPAGTGKTFALDAAREAWQAQRRPGARLRAVGEGRRRAARPGGDRHDHDRPAHLRPRPRRRDWPAARCWSSTRPAWSARATSPACSTRAEQAQAKLVLVGDDRQLPEIQAGGAVLGAGRPARRDRADARSAASARRGTATRSRRCATATSSASPAPTTSTAGSWRRRRADAARAALVDDWWAATERGEQALMIAHRRADVADLNRRARERMRAAGRLGADALVTRRARLRRRRPRRHDPQRPPARRRQRPDAARSTGDRPRRR